MEQEKSELCKYLDVKTVDHAQAHHLCTIVVWNFYVLYTMPILLSEL